MQNLKTLSLVLLITFSLDATAFAANCPVDRAAGDTIPESSSSGAPARVVEQRNTVYEEAERCQKAEPKPAPPACPKDEEPQVPEEPDTVTPTGEAAALLDVLQSTGQIEAFNRLFALSLSAEDDSMSEEEAAALQALADEPGFEAQAEEGILERTDRLYTSLQADAAQRARFNSVFGAELPAEGPPSDKDRTVLFSITGDPAYDHDAFLGALTSTGDLFAMLRADSTDRSQFNDVFGTTVAASGELTTSDRQALFSLAGDPAFDLTAFSNVLPATWSLLSALHSDEADRAAFNARYSTTIAATGAPSAADRTVLFNITGDPDFNLSAFLESLEEGSGFLGAIQSQGQVNNFNLLFGASLPQSGSTLSAADQQLLADIAGDPNFSQANFLTVLPRTSGLLSALQANGSQRTQFNQLFGSFLAASGAPSAADRTILFGVAGDPNFVQAGFLPVLGRTSGLLTALQNDEADRNAFNSLFETNIQATGSPNANDRTVLFGVAGDPNYNEEAFLGSLDGDDEPAGGPDPGPAPIDGTRFSGDGRDLVAAIQADDSVDDFNSLFGTQIQDTGITGTAADVQLVSDVAGDPNFNLASFRQVLPVTGSLLRALRLSGSRREQFNSLFGTDLDSGTPSGSERQALFDLAGDPAFEERNFLTVLERTSRLLTALQDDATRRANFNTRFDTTIGTGVPDPSDRGLLFGLAGDPNFDLDTFLRSLDTSVALTRPLPPTPVVPLLTG